MALERFLDKLFAREVAPRAVAPSLTAVPTDTELVFSEAAEPAPSSIRQTVEFDVESGFTDYVGTFLNEGATRVFLDREQKRISAVLDYHGPDRPSWCQHRATFRMRRTDDFAQWSVIFDKKIGQVDLCERLEDLIHTIDEPDAATVLESIKSFEALRKVTFRSVKRLDDGTFDFTYEEQDTNRPGSVALPRQLVLKMQFYYGMPEYYLRVRVRYRMHDGALMFTLVPDRLERLLDTMWDDVTERVIVTLGASGIGAEAVHSVWKTPDAPARHIRKIVGEGQTPI